MGQIQTRKASEPARTQTLSESHQLTDFENGWIITNFRKQGEIESPDLGQIKGSILHVAVEAERLVNNIRYVHGQHGNQSHGRF